MEGAAFAGAFAGRPDRAAVSGHDVEADGQTQTDASRHLALALQLKEALEDALQ